MKKLILIIGLALTAALSLAQITPGNNPLGPSDLKRAVLQGGVRKPAQRRERWWTGAVAYQGGTVTQAYNVLASSNTSPDVLTLDKASGTGNAPALDSGGVTGTQVTIRGMAGDTGPNATTCYVTTNSVKTGFTDNKHVACYSDSNLATPIAGNGVLADYATMGVGTTHGGNRGSNGESADFINISGSGCLTQIFLACGLNFEQFDSVLWIYVDGDAPGSPSLIIPFCDLYGSNFITQNTTGSTWTNNKLTGNQLFTSDNLDLELNAYDNYTATAIGGMTFRLKFPIPFLTGCRATIMHRGTSDNTSSNYYSIGTYTPDVTSAMRLKAQTFPALVTASGSTDRNATITTASSADFTMLSVAAGQSGWVVGSFMSCISFATDSNGSTIFERNVYFSSTWKEYPPTYQTSGFEDYWGSSYYWGGANHFQGTGVFAPFLREGGTFNSVTDTAYAILFKDNLQTDGGLRFTDGALMKWVAGPDSSAGIVLSTGAARATILYYLAP